MGPTVCKISAEKCSISIRAQVARSISLPTVNHHHQQKAITADWTSGVDLGSNSRYHVGQVCKVKTRVLVWGVKIDRLCMPFSVHRGRSLSQQAALYCLLYHPWVRTYVGVGKQVFGYKKRTPQFFYFSTQRSFLIAPPNLPTPLSPMRPSNPSTYTGGPLGWLD